ncbi:deoxyribonuclease-1 [Azomonas agilis]|uniref:Deoxyribonuclease-1 n=1 Tax=Azomonas agilis TaxID=116849 RepID=A0A562HZY5_9GAMM|nr:deoxyribonuclease-1 [Azomonas agilis]
METLLKSLLSILHTKQRRLAAAVIAALVSAVTAYLGLRPQPEVQTFEQAKVALREQVYYDQNSKTNPGTFYCGCRWEWVGRSGGRVDLASCGYQVRSQQTRAERTEWEHVVPAWVFGHQLQCWQKGGRKNCKDTDATFRRMEGDMHNLTPAIGEVNADRSNYSYGMLSSSVPKSYGSCPTRVDFKNRVVEPRDAVKGQAARIYFYMHDRYGLNMSRQQQQLFMAWDRQFPVSDWERERDRRIAKVQGNSNPFVTGKRTWVLDAKASDVAEVPPIEEDEDNPESNSTVAAQTAPIVGNRNSRVYHLPEGCPSYERVTGDTRVEFRTVAEAEAAGFKKAGNCR